MQVTVRNRPAFANIHVKMAPGDVILGEADAMASMSPTVQIHARFNGGFFSALAKRYFGGESMFINEFVALDEGEIVFTQPLPGDIECIELKGTSLFLQPGAFIACEPTVHLGVGWAGFSSWIGREGLFRLKVSGQGRVWFGAYGGIFVREIEDEYVVDTGHLVAYEPTIHIKVGMAGGIFSSFFSGEGLVTRVYGPGRIYLQSRSLSGLAAWTDSFLFMH
ncbi:MAG: TIGR00266 family protein [Gemmatales bacterium]|nr:MAG: TIGR00266 family protein [Gemmatales bacterium]